MIRVVSVISGIHILRYFRIINQLGIFRVLFLLAIVAYVIKATLQPGMMVLQSMLVVSVVFQSHFSRKDYVLLNNLGLNNPGYFMMLYLLFVSPFVLLYLIWPDFKALGILISGTLLTTLFNRPFRKVRKIQLPSFRFIPAGSWEWRVGLRRYLPVFVAAYIIPAVFYQQDYLFAASVLLIAITTNAFLISHEPVNMLVSVKSSAVACFWYKVYLQCAFFTLFSLPLLISSLILYPEGIRPVLLLFANSLAVQVFAVSLKYAGYRPGQITPYNMAIIFLLNFTFIIPALLPLPVIMAVIFGRKAISQLKLIAG